MKLRALIYCVLLSLLSGCGFQLRGSVPMALKTVFVQAENSPRIAAEVSRLLVEEGVALAPNANAKAAQAVLYIRNENLTRRFLSISAVTGRIEEMELNLRVDLEARTPQNKVLLEPQNLLLLREYSFDQNAILAKDAEEQVLREELYQDITAQVMRRIRAIQLP